MDEMSDIHGYKIGYDWILMDTKRYSSRIFMDKMSDIPRYKIGYQRISVDRKG